MRGHTARARHLCFISSRHIVVLQNTIIDTFLGRTDIEIVDKNFHPTVSHIRKALNSNQPLRELYPFPGTGDLN